MVSTQSVEDQLKRIGFSAHSWGRTEVSELPSILLEDEEIYECVNGIYEGGFALCVATNVRVLLVDKKPLKYLTVEDLRFDMINEIDYSHRLMGAQISISAGSKNLKFRSYNQPRLRKLIGHVQHCIAEAKKQQSDHQVGQNQHLEKINEQLQTYLLAQHQNQQELNERLKEAQEQGVRIASTPEIIQPNPELADYLFAQSLLAQHRQQQNSANPDSSVPRPNATINRPPQSTPASPQLADLYAEGMQEVFGTPPPATATPVASQPQPTPTHESAIPPIQLRTQRGLEVNPLRIACSKLPMALRNRKFGRPSFHAHSQAALAAPRTTTVPGSAA